MTWVCFSRGLASNKASLTIYIGMTAQGLTVWGFEVFKTEVRDDVSTCWVCASKILCLLCKDFVAQISNVIDSFHFPNMYS